MSLPELLATGFASLGLLAAGAGIGAWLKGKPPRKTNWDDVDRRVDEKRQPPLKR